MALPRRDAELRHLLDQVLQDGDAPPACPDCTEDGCPRQHCERQLLRAGELEDEYTRRLTR